MRLAVASLLALAPLAAHADKYRRLRAGEIAPTFTGMEFTDEVHFRYLFERGGRLSSIALGRRGSGTWRVEGDELCTTGGPGMRPCHQVWIAGQHLQLRRSDDADDPEEGLLQPPSSSAWR